MVAAAAAAAAKDSSGSAITRKLYRALMMEFRQLSRNRQGANRLHLREPIDPREYGKHLYYSGLRPYFGWTSNDVLNILNRFRKVDRVAVSGDELQAICKREFRRDSSLKDKKVIQSRRALILDAAKFYAKQLSLDSCSSLSATNGVEVEATSSYLGVASAATVNPGHVFLYRIRITNHNRQAMKIQARYWRTVDEDGRIEETPKNSPGVLGRYPELSEKESFVYTSATRLQRDKGMMMGSFQVKEMGSETTFDVAVEPFRLNRKCAVVINRDASPL